MSSPQGGHPAVRDLQKALLSEIDPPDLDRSRSAPETGSLAPSALKQPGGFRRDFLNAQAEERGVPLEDRPPAWQQPLLESVQPLIRVGYFESVLGITDSGAFLRPSTRGEAGVNGTRLGIIKGFLGVGVTFMPAIYSKGGWVLASIGLFLMGVLTFYSIRLLLQCRDKLDAATYGEIACAACGPAGELLVQASLVVLQFSVCVSYLIFVVKSAASLGYTDPVLVIAVQILILLPLFLIRHVHNLEVTNLLADFLIVVGLVFMFATFFSGIESASEQQSLDPVRTDKLAVVFGMMVCSLEGVPTIIPVRNAMREPEQFNAVFSPVFVIIVVLYILFGFAGYASYGEDVQTPVLLNLPDAAWVTWLKAGYCAALLLTAPFLFIPAARITELWCFGVTEGGERKWAKNGLRAAELVFFGLVALKGAKTFDVFLSIAGGACGTPICFLYPALFHLLLCADTPAAKLIDAFLVVLGAGVVVFVVEQAIVG